MLKLSMYQDMNVIIPYFMQNYGCGFTFWYTLILNNPL